MAAAGNLTTGSGKQTDLLAQDKKSKVDLPAGFNEKSDYLITTFNIVKDENGDVIPNIRRNEETKVYTEEAYESAFVGVTNRMTKVQAKSMMELLGYRWEIVYKPKK